MICIADQFAGHHAHDACPLSFRVASAAPRLDDGHNRSRLALINHQCQHVLSANLYPGA